MKKLLFIILTSIFSLNLYAKSNIKTCDAYDIAFRQFKATIEYYPELDHYKISVKDEIYYFAEKDKDGTYYGKNGIRYSPQKDIGFGLQHYMRKPDYSFKNCK